VITSPANPLIKELRGLHRAEERRRRGLVLVEGRRAIDAFLRRGFEPRHCFHVAGDDPPPGWPAAAVAPVSAAAMARLSAQKTPAGFCACFPLPPPAALTATRPAMVLVGVSDPGNCGTLARSAAAFGVGQLVLVGGADPWGAKALRASAGEIAALAVHRLGAGATPEDLPARGRLEILDPRGDDPGDDPGDDSRTWLVIGNEAHGPGDAWLAAAERRWRLPMAAGVDSLNAAVAGSIAAFLRFADPRRLR